MIDNTILETQAEAERLATTIRGTDRFTRVNVHYLDGRGCYGVVCHHFAGTVYTFASTSAWERFRAGK